MLNAMAGQAVLRRYLAPQHHANAVADLVKQMIFCSWLMYSEYMNSGADCIWPEVLRRFDAGTRMRVHGQRDDW